MDSRAASAICILVVLNACGQRARERPQVIAENATESAPPAPVAYPDGPWWNPDTGRVLVSSAHIFVTHRDAPPFVPSTDTEFDPREVPFERSDRSRVEALGRAFRIHDEIVARPERFAALAREMSDEASSAPVGGARGTLRASMLPHPYVNALAALRADQVSGVFETEQGFHILKRLKVPPAEQVALARILIKHDHSRRGYERTDRPVPVRSHAEARQAAMAIAAEALAAPNAFGALAAKYSDAEDALRAGDFGVRSTHDALGTDALLYSTAAQLVTNAVSHVVETDAGFNIIKRVPVEGRARIAASVIIVPSSDAGNPVAQSGAERSQKRALQMTRELIAELTEHPERWHDRRIEYCEVTTPFCDGPVTWTEGGQFVALELALQRLRVGQVAPEPVLSPLGPMVVAREEPAPVQVPSVPSRTASVLLDFGAPAAELLVPEEPAQEDGPQQAAALRQYWAQAYADFRTKALGGAFRLSAQERQQLTKIIDGLMANLSAPIEDEDMEAPLMRADDALIGLLGPERHEKWQRMQRLYWGTHPAP